MWLRVWSTNQRNTNRLDRYIRGDAAVTMHYGDVNSADYGMILTDIHIWKSPEPVYTAFSVPGRNGNLVQSEHCWRNVPIRYKFVIPAAFQDRYDDFINAVAVKDGYQRIWDSLNPELYREGQILTSIDPQMIDRNEIGQLELTISCKPQRFLLSGQRAVRFDASPVYLENNWQAAKPLIKIYGNGLGNLHIGSCTVEVKSLQDHLYLDCDLMDAYRQTGAGAPENANSTVLAPEYPVLAHGTTMISWDGGITAVEITPRWWKL